MKKMYVYLVCFGGQGAASEAEKPGRRLMENPRHRLIKVLIRSIVRE